MINRQKRRIAKDVVLPHALGGVVANATEPGTLFDPFHNKNIKKDPAA
jgi:hypothetical protein